MSVPINRVMVYTHNSIGLGHAFRTLSLITGMRRWRPDMDFLVLSGTSIPHIFFKHGIEVIKLPSIKLEIDLPDTPMRPRYLHNMDLASLCDFRRRLIQDAFDFFRPDVLMVEHNTAGLMNELVPLLMKKWVRLGAESGFSLVYLSRGIMEDIPRVETPLDNIRHGSTSIDIGSLYDRIFVLEDREVAETQKWPLANHAALNRKIRYLGKITNKVYDELLGREQTLERFGLPDKKILLITLGRSRKTYALVKRLLQLLDKTGINRECRVAIVIDPYIDAQEAEKLRCIHMAGDVQFLTFIPDLVHLIRHSHLVISRAGYNTVNEILLTGTRAILIPEKHGSGEQEYRVRTVPKENITVIPEDAVFLDGVEDEIIAAFNAPLSTVHFHFDKYAIGKSIIDELEDHGAGSDSTASYHF